MHPIRKVIRKGNRIYTVYDDKGETLVATTAETALDRDNAVFVAGAIAGWYGVSLEEED